MHTLDLMLVMHVLSNQDTKCSYPFAQVSQNIVQENTNPTQESMFANALENTKYNAD